MSNEPDSVPEPETESKPSPYPAEDPGPEVTEKENADVQRAIRWLEEKWSSREGDEHRCPLCGEHNWRVGGPVAFPAWRRTLGSAALIFFTVTCYECGYTQLLSATTPTNLLQDEDEDGGDE